MRPGRSLHGSSWQRTRGLESCTTFRSLWGVICLKPAVKEAGGKEGGWLHRLFWEVWLGLPRDSEVGATLLRRGQVSQAEELT